MKIRLLNRSVQIAGDVAVLSLAYGLAYLLRFEATVPLLMWRTMAWTLPYVVAVQYMLLRLFGVHRLTWRYVGLMDARRIAYAVAASALVLVIARLVGVRIVQTYEPVSRGVIPLGVTFSDSAFALLGLTGVRVLRRIFSEQAEIVRRNLPTSSRVPTILIGAGRAGALVAKEIAARPDLRIEPVGFIDDDRDKIGLMIHGIPVLGSTDRLGALCSERGVQQALITIASAPSKDIRRIVDLCREAEIPAKVIPGLFEIVGGQVNLSRIRRVAIEDLLRRDPVTLDVDAIGGLIADRTILVTGAGGSIGSELCRQIARFRPKSLVLVESSENNLFHIERHMRAEYPDLAFHARLVDIRDVARLEAVFERHRPAAVFHAAAHKHVPMMELNPSEAIKNNVFGTRAVAEISDRFGVSVFVMISTDKAVNPTSVMGASKRAAEILIQAMSQRSRTRFVAVRFGNVLGSQGSIVPIFQEQIANGGPLTVTHPEMKRYFMTIPEACQLVLEAGTMGKGGEIFVLDMGEPVRILDLARDLIALSGLQEDEIEIKFTGVRPGEKLFEELSLVEEEAEKTHHAKVFIGRIKPHSWEEVTRALRELEIAAATDDPEDIRGALRRLVREYAPPPGDHRSLPGSVTPTAAVITAVPSFARQTS